MHFYHPWLFWAKQQSQRELKLHSPAVAIQVRRSRSGLFFLESRQKPAQSWKEFDSIQLELLLSKYKSKFVLGLKLIITEMAVTSLASYTQTAIFWFLFLNLTSQKLFKGEILKKNQFGENNFLLYALLSQKMRQTPDGQFHNYYDWFSVAFSFGNNAMKLKSAPCSCHYIFFTCL